MPEVPECLHPRFESDLSQPDNHADIRQEADFVQQPRPAGVHFHGERFVLRRSTAESGNDVAIAQPEPVGTVHGLRLKCKSCFMKGPEQPVPAFVTGEHPPGPVPSVRGWCKADEQDPGMRIPKARERFPPVRVFGKPAHFRPRRFLPPLHQPGTLPAPDEMFVQGTERPNARSGFTRSPAIHFPASMAGAFPRTSSTVRLVIGPR